MAKCRVFGNGEQLKTSRQFLRFERLPKCSERERENQSQTTRTAGKINRKEFITRNYRVAPGTLNGDTEILVEVIKRNLRNQIKEGTVISTKKKKKKRRQSASRCFAVASRASCNAPSFKSFGTEADLTIPR